MFYSAETGASYAERMSHSARVHLLFYKHVLITLGGEVRRWCTHSALIFPLYLFYFLYLVWRILQGGKSHCQFFSLRGEWSVCSYLSFLLLSDLCTRILSRVSCRQEIIPVFWVFGHFQTSHDERIHFQMCTSIQENYRLPPEHRMDLEV